MNHIKNTIESYGSNNLFLNLIKTTTGKICKTDYKGKHKFFKKKSKSYLHTAKYFPNHINREENKSISTEAKYLFYEEIPKFKKIQKQTS